MAQTSSVDLAVLLCLGRVWFLRGKEDKMADHLRKSLEITVQAQALGPENQHVRFNVAFVQFTLADLLRSVPEHQKTSAEMEEAAKGLDVAIE